MARITVIDQISSWRYRVAALALALESYDDDNMLCAAGRSAREIYDEMLEIEAETTGLCLSEVTWDRHNNTLSYTPLDGPGELKPAELKPL